MISTTDAALALWLAQSAVATLAAAAYRSGLPRPDDPGEEPPVAVILPAKGARLLASHLSLLRAQRYERYRIIAAVESADDPACQLLEAAKSQPGAPIEVVVAGLARDTGQKVWNLLAALDRLTTEDEVVAFIDADTLPTPLWLPRLMAVLVNSGRLVATGYRWMAPADDRWSSACAAAANNSVASLPRGLLPLTIVWGGSVAMRRTAFEALRIREFWRGAISDDGQMAYALRLAGVIAQAPRQALLLTPVSFSWAEFLAFGIRQYRLVYIHRPRSWAVAFLCLWAPPICFLLAAPALAAGSPLALCALALVLAFGELRTRLRRSIQHALWPDSEGASEDNRWRVERLMRPFWHCAHAMCAAIAPFSRTIDWAGVRYRVEGPQSLVIEARRNR
jgi:hypothetical protein